jgi:hypothetical protein
MITQHIAESKTLLRYPQLVRQARCSASRLKAGSVLNGAKEVITRAKMAAIRR